MSRFVRPADRAAPPEATSARRLGSLALALGGLLIFLAPARQLGVETEALPRRLLPSSDGFAVAVFGLCAAMFGLTRWQRFSARLVLSVGLAFEVVLAGAIAAYEGSLLGAPVGTPRLSLVVLVTLTFPVVVPAEPIRRVATTALATATAPALTHLFDDGSVQATVGFVMGWLPTYGAAIVAILTAGVARQMRLRAEQAHEIGSYRLERRLAVGGMGEVWRARHHLLARPAAVKLLRPDRLVADVAAAQRRFEREAQATATLTSPHTVQLYDFGVAEDGRWYYAMELLDGVDLRRHVLEQGPLSAERALRLLAQVCASLHEAHEIGLVHGDIKPENIILGTVGGQPDFAKVVDFGLTRTIDTSSGRAPSPRGSHGLVGTPAYMAPELVTLEPPVDHRVDLYSLGCVAYWLLTGRLVFEADQVEAVLVRHVLEAPAALSEVTKTYVPPCLDRLVLSCLAKHPNDRPQSAAELRRELERCLRILAADTDRPGPAPITGAPRSFREGGSPSTGSASLRPNGN